MAIPLYLSSRGLTTSPIPYGHRHFQVDFDFVDHQLHATDSNGRSFTMPLEPKSVARFYREFMDELRGLGIEVRISTRPVEVVESIPFETDEQHASYDPHQAELLWRAMLQADRVMKVFQSGFVGKASPVHLFWGGFDLATPRYSGRNPESDGFRSATVRPAKAFFDERFRDFVLPYDAVRGLTDPDAAVLEFFESTYEAGADLGGWDRSALEPAVRPDRPPRRAWSTPPDQVEES